MAYACTDARSVSRLCLDKLNAMYTKYCVNKCLKRYWRKIREMVDIAD